ncbi:SdrD B-like domain-containing protein [uncultured Paracoccus sp.]|uniref:SdrD B-like domain-containing protein n=3 Tax=uncultured Paracoccus sp. TaxID=189685 RepID=UPI002607E531|nr:SdrD B-like domain-containing protein [uncultured Paracoccus sp.]
MIEIQIEGHGSAGAGNGDFTFYGARPPAGTTLTNVQTYSLQGSSVDYSCLGSGTVDPGTASLSGRFFDDANHNNIDDGDAGVAGATVQLWANGAQGWYVVATTTTNANGDYQFTGLAANPNYVVRFVNETGLPFVQSNVGSNDAIDSDIDQLFGANGQVNNINLSIGQHIPNIDDGVHKPNAGPDALNDTAKTCADESKTVNVLANDSDPDGDALTITAVNGQAISEGGSVNIDGVVISLTSGQLVVDGTAAYADLLLGQTAKVTYSYSISDGNGGTDTANLDMTFSGAKNTLETIKDSLPASGLLVGAYSDVFDGPYISVSLSATGDARFDGISFANAYCVSLYDPLTPGDVVPYKMYLADADSVPAGVVPNPQNLDLINWILNQDFSSQNNGDGAGQTYTEAEIQGAIWQLTDDFAFVAPGLGTEANALEIYQLALANGEGFEAGEGDIIGLILDPTDEAELAGNAQPLIVGVAFDALAQDCFCF